MIDKLLATWWAICCGSGFVHYIYNHEEHSWSFVGAIIYFLLFLATIYQIKAQKSVWEWMVQRHKKRQADRRDPNNWSV